MNYSNFPILKIPFQISGSHGGHCEKYGLINLYAPELRTLPALAGFLPVLYFYLKIDAICYI
jgi:hypothetical protein